MEIIKKPKIYAAFIVFAAAVLMLLFVAAPIQAALGTWGLILTEIIIAVLAVISVYIFGYNLREALPFKVPKLRQVFGVLLLWAGALLIGLLASMFTMMLFPDDMYQLSKALGDFLTEGPLLLAFISASLFPAVCEEILCRGFMQYSLGGLRRQWLVIGLVGVLFGMLHLSPYRIAPTMILGITLAYIMAVTKNLVLPMLLHFTNNAFSFLISLSAKGAAAPTDASMLSRASVVSLGVFLFLCTVVPWLFIAGAKLLRTKIENKEKPLKRKALIAAILISVFCFAAGIGVTAAGSAALVGDMQVLNMGYTIDASVSSQPDTYPVVIEEDGNYQLSFVITPMPGAVGTTCLTLTGPGGEEYFSETAGSIFGNTQKFLPAGEYTLTCSYDYTNTEPAPVTINFIIMRMPA